MTDFNEIKMKLEARLAELSDRTEDIEEDLSEPHDDDWSENATESEDEEVLGKIGDIALKEMEQIKMALSKIENGSYGQCNGCGEKIALKRLEAIPHAAKCVKCAG